MRADGGEGLSPLEMDALTELGNIGAGNATTALSQMLGDRVIRLSSPAARLVPLAELGDELGNPDEPVAAVFLRVSGGATGQVAFILPEAAARSVLSALVGAQRGGGSRTPLPERGTGDLEASALLELGNIVVTSYLNALSELTSLSMVPSVPAAAEDMLGAVVSSMMAELESPEDRVLAVEARFHDEHRQVAGHLLFLPERGQLGGILSALGLSGQNPGGEGT